MTVQTWEVKGMWRTGILLSLFSGVSTRAYTYSESQSDIQRKAMVYAVCGWGLSSKSDLHFKSVLKVGA